MKVLMSLKVQDHNIEAITQMFWADFQSMDKLVAWMENNINATESEIIRKAVEIYQNKAK